MSKGHREKQNTMKEAVLPASESTDRSTGKAVNSEGRKSKAFAGGEEIKVPLATREFSKSRHCTSEPRPSAVVMASGHSKRFGSNKLLADFMGEPLIEHLFRIIPRESFEEILVVSIYDEILSLAKKYGFIPIFNPDTTDDTAKTIRLGITNVKKNSPGCAFFAGDQPGLSRDTILKLTEAFAENPDKICLPVCEGRRGNPVIFPSSLYGELASLPSGKRGGLVVESHPGLIKEVKILRALDLEDSDYPEDLRRITDILQTF